MKTIARRAQPDTRSQAFFKGLLAELPLQLASWGVYVFVRERVDPLGTVRATFGVDRIASLLVLLISSIALGGMWWGRARWRSYGVMAGFVAWPPLLAGFFLVVATMLHVIS